MTVAELIQALEQFSPQTPVRIAYEGGLYQPAPKCMTRCRSQQGYEYLQRRDELQAEGYMYDDVIVLGGENT